MEMYCGNGYTMLYLIPINYMHLEMADSCDGHHSVGLMVVHFSCWLYRDIDIGIDISMLKVGKSQRLQ